MAEGRVARLDGITDGGGGAEPENAAVARLEGLLGVEPSPATPADDGTSAIRAEPADLGQLDGAERALPSPVAALADEQGGAAAEAAPVALFDTEELGAGRTDVTVAELGPGALRRGSAARVAGRPGGGRSRAGRPREDGPREDGPREDGPREDGPRDDRSRDDRAGGPRRSRSGVGGRAVAPAGEEQAAGEPRYAGEQGEPGEPAAEEQPRSRSGAGRSGGRWSGTRRVGGQQELDPGADPVAVAREICLRLLTERARTRQELAQALRRKGVPDEAAASVLGRFDEVGLIDDAAFAGQWVRSRHAQRGLARRAIAYELRRKGVSDDDAGEALAEVDPESEERRARELVDRKLRSLAVATTEQRAAAARRLVGMLARKGYGAGTAYRVVKEALADRGAEVDELGDAEPSED